MTPEQVAVVQDSFQKLRPALPEVADLFYKRIFEIAPEARALFPADMDDQVKKFTAMMVRVVTSLDKLDEILGDVQELGRRHNCYKVEPAHYDVVAEPWLWTLEQGLGEDCTEDVRQAWIVAYTALADVMKDAAANQAAA